MKCRALVVYLRLAVFLQFCLGVHVQLWADTPPPMRQGNGSALENKNISWPRPDVLPESRLNNPSFSEKKINDYIEQASTQQTMKPATLFPENPSEFMLKVILLHTVKDSVASMHDEAIAQMVDRLLLKNLLAPLSLDEAVGYTPVPGFPSAVSPGAGVVMSGCFDPVEVYRNWKRKKRALQTQMVLLSLFGDKEQLLNKSQTDSLSRSRSFYTPAAQRPVPSWLLNDTVIAPSKPKFTAPLFGTSHPDVYLSLPPDSLRAIPKR